MGLSRTAGLIGYNRFSDLSELRTLVLAARASIGLAIHAAGQPTLRAPHAWCRRISVACWPTPNLSVRQRQSLLRYTDARASSRLAYSVLPRFARHEDDMSCGGKTCNVGGHEFFRSNLKQQMQGALLVFQSGLGSAADLSLGGFDSHDQHDAVSEGLLTHLTSALNYFWDTAESLGLAERITLVVGSDFGRTNFYNEGDGKDHWPIGSYMVMERGAPWGDRVVGLTDELHFASPINQDTLRADRNGVIMTPSHVHKALWEYLGLEAFAADRGLTLPDAERLPLFDPFVSSTG